MVHTAFGSVESIQRFLYSMASFGDYGACPISSTRSVHNATVGRLTELLWLHEPAVTVSNWTSPGLSALGCCGRLVASGSDPAALVVCGEYHTPWRRSMVARLLRGRRCVAGGVWAALVEDSPGPGRVFASGEGPGPVIGEDERDAGWWPGSVMERIPSENAGPFVVREGSQAAAFAARAAAP